MKKFFESDSFLKIASVAIAILLWLYIIVVLDPAVEVEVRDLPIQFVGQEQLAENGFSVVSESATSINVKVKGSRKKMGRYDMKTIIAKVDMSGLTETGRHELPVSIVVPFENAGISSQNHYRVEVQLEKTVSKELSVEVINQGSLAAGYMPGEVKVSSSKITITGPESVVGKIEKAGVVLDYGNAKADFKQTLPILLYDGEGRELTSQDALLKRISQNIAEATVACEVEKLRTVKITPQFDSTTEDDKSALAMVTYTVNPINVRIYGDDEETLKISEILTEKIPMSKFLDGQTVLVNLIIPKNVKVLDNVTEVEITLNKNLKSEKD